MLFKWYFNLEFYASGKILKEFFYAHNIILNRLGTTPTLSLARNYRYFNDAQKQKL